MMQLLKNFFSPVFIYTSNKHIRILEILVHVDFKSPHWLGIFSQISIQIRRVITKNRSRTQNFKVVCVYVCVWKECGHYIRM